MYLFCFDFIVFMRHINLTPITIMLTLTCIMHIKDIEFAKYNIFDSEFQTRNFLISNYII